MKYTIRLYNVREVNFQVEADDRDHAIDMAYSELEKIESITEDEDWELPSEVFGESTDKNVIEGWVDQ